ncbi:FtsX-like permease family protein [Runella sp. CRIBMP]|uniref:ABC transporter permease n=1 Tax=Runella sp. CRIBMP TaxID=2683261 RepID=UPI001412FE9F|nr:ABC transporter permease [Runella sp. CRIBMP]NBB19898.1 FtsX-like permease family protein [Runella sp. CRIBMP]
MLKNYFKIAVRSLLKDKGYTALNILGLTIGLTFSLFLVFYITDELSYDRYHEKADRIYRVGAAIKEPERADKVAVTQFPLGPTLKKEFPEVEHAVRFVRNGDKTLFKKGDTQFFEEKVFYADSNVFDVFTYKFIAGDAKRALIAPNSLVLTRSAAEKYFQTTDNVVGKSLQGKKDTYNITAIIEDVPKNSHLRFNALISASSLGKDFGNNWGNFGFYTYALLTKNSDYKSFEKKLIPMYQKYMASIFSPYNVKINYVVQPIVDIHLRSDLNNEPEELGSMSYIYTFSAVALFMILIACINYMNLTTARSARRAKEIGIRKVSGSLQRHLIAQFLTESTVITLASLVLSLLLIAILLPVFNDISGKTFTFGTIFQPITLISILTIVVVVGLVGGSYPAFYLAKFNPLVVLKGNLAKASSNAPLRQTLVVLQFTISMVMLISTWVVYDQLNFMKNKDLGYSKDQVLVINMPPINRDGRNEIKLMKSEFLKNPKVLSASSSWYTPNSNGQSFNLMEIEGKTGFVNLGVEVYGVDPHYLQTLGIQLSKGRNFTELDRADSLRRMIVNEALIKKMGWTDALGKKIRFAGDTANLAEVVGVFKDFHQKSLYNPIEPLILVYRENNGSVQAKISPNDIPSTLAHLEKSYKKVFPQHSFQYNFLDQDFQSQFAADQKRGTIFTAFSSLTVLIACLGLLGLVAFTTEQRRKEISVRKVMGAETGHIVTLISKGFLYLVGVSCLIAFPIAWYFMNQWLEPFPYKTNISPITFLLSAGLVLLITLLTVSFHTVKAALMNPVKSLKAE